MKIVFSSRNAPDARKTRAALATVAVAWLASLAMSTTVAAFTAAPAGPAPSSDLQAVLAELQATNEAWLTNDREYRRQRDQGALIDTDASDFAEYVAKLRRKVLVECERYKDAGGDPVAAGIDCGKLDDSESGSEAAPVADLPVLTPAATEAEKDAALDAELRGIEESLDTMLDNRPPVFGDARGTQGTGAQGGTFGGAAGTGGGAAGDGGTTGEVGMAGAGGMAGEGGLAGEGGTAGEGGMAGEGGVAATEARGGGGSEGGQGATTVAGGSPGGVAEQGAYQGSGKTGSQSAPPRRAGGSGGVDDDALARQLREAAENEPDPVLREKLWEEYRKYKGSLK